MRFTGFNLKLVEYGLECALTDTQNMIATAPAQEVGSDLYNAYFRRAAQLEKLLNKVDEALYRENQ